MIGFLLPKLAWLALLAGAPVLIHLLNRIRLRRVEFSSLVFLRDVRREKFNWLRLKELLLLVARSAVLLLLFLGLSRPFLRRGVFGTRREVSAVLIVDNSGSMHQGGAFGQAIAHARTYLDGLAGTSEVALLTSTDLSAEFLTRDIARLRLKLDSLEPGYSAAGLGPAVEQAVALLERAVLPQREIVIFSDRQRRALADWPEIGDKRIAVQLDECGSRDWNNVAVVAVRPKEALPQPGRALGLQARVRNFGGSEESRTVTLRLRGSTENIPVTVAPGGEKDVSFEKQLFEPGCDTGVVDVSPDSLRTDDRRYFVAEVPRPVPILVVGEEPQDTLYLARALAPETSSVFRVTTRLEAGLRTVELSRYRVVALVNPVSLAASDWQRVDDHIRQGGAVLIALGREPKERGLLARFATMAGEARPTGFVTIEQADYGHPVLEGFRGRADLSLARFFRYLKLAPVNGEVLLRFADGSPYLIEARSARVMVVAGDFQPASSDLPFRALFVPLVQRLASYLAREAIRRDYRVGETLVVEAPAVGLLKVRTPDGEFNVVPEKSGHGAQLRLAVFATPGIYEVGNELYAVNVPVEESDLTRASDQELASRGIVPFRQAGVRSDLTNAFLLAAALALVAEMLILII